MKKKQYYAPKAKVLSLWSEDVMTVSGETLGVGEKGVWDNEIFN